MVYGLPDFRKEVNKSFGYGTKVKSDEFKMILESYSKKVIDEIIYNNYEYYIPYIGNISIFKNKSKPVPGKTRRVIGLPIDRRSSIEEGCRILHENEHTNGYTYKIIWYNRGMVKHQTKFMFKASKYVFRRYLAKLLKNKDKYGVIEAPIKDRNYGI